jgi:hypothetical protein
MERIKLIYKSVKLGNNFIHRVGPKGNRLPMINSLGQNKEVYGECLYLLKPVRAPVAYDLNIKVKLSPCLTN